MTDLPPNSQLEAKKQLARRIPEEIFVDGDLDLLDELYVGDAVERNAMGTHQGRPVIRESYNSFPTAFPDVSQTVEDIGAEGDLVAVRITSRGMHKGKLGGLEPTGKEIEVEQMFFARIEDGMITERWFLPDNLSLLQQLDVIEFPPS